MPGLLSYHSYSTFFFHDYTLSEATGSLGCRRNSSQGSVLIKQLTELQLLTGYQITIEDINLGEIKIFPIFPKFPSIL